MLAVSRDAILAMAIDTNTDDTGGYLLCIDPDSGEKR